MRRNLPAKQVSGLPAARAPELPADSALAGFLSANTKRAYTIDLLQFFEADSLAEITMERLLAVTPEQVVTWRDRMREKKPKALAAATIARKLSALRSIYKYLVARGLISVNPAHPDLVRAPKQGTIRRTDYLDWDQAEKFLSQPDREKQLGRRDYAMLLLVLKRGLRRSELCGLRDEDFSLRGGRRVLSIRGKGEKERHIHIPGDVWDAIAVWTRSRPKGVEYTFVTIRGIRMTGNGFWKIVKRYAKAAGVEEIHPHTLRATCIMFLLEKGVPISEVQQIMGHSRGETTLAYVRELDLARGKAVDALDDLGASE